MPDPLMDTLDEIDRKSGKSGTFLLSPRVSLCLIRYRGTLLVTEETSPILDYSWIWLKSNAPFSINFKIVSTKLFFTVSLSFSTPEYST